MKLLSCKLVSLPLITLVLLNGCGIFGPSREQRVIQGLRSGKDNVRLKTLSRLNDDITPPMREPLEEVLESGINPTIRALAADKLGALGSEESVPVLRPSSRRDNAWVVRRRALRALGKILGSEVSDDLRRTLRRDSKAAVKVEAVNIASEQLDEGDLKDILLLALQDEKSAVRIAAQQKLVQLTDHDFPPGDYERWEEALQE